MKILKSIMYGVVAVLGIEAIYLLNKKPELKKKLSKDTTEEAIERMVDELVGFNKNLFSDVLARVEDGVEAPVNAVKEFVGDKTQQINDFWDAMDQKIQHMHVSNKSDAKAIAKDFADMKSKSEAILKRLSNLKKS